MEITRVSEKDLEALAALYQQLIPNDISLPKMQRTLAKNQDNPNHIVLAARIDGKLVGSLLAVVCEMLFGQCNSFMVVEDVIVDKRHRNSGIGKALMRHIESYARAHNCSYIMLITDMDRKASQEFYRSLGYKTDEYCAFKKHIL